MSLVSFSASLLAAAVLAAGGPLHRAHDLCAQPDGGSFPSDAGCPVLCASDAQCTDGGVCNEGACAARCDPLASTCTAGSYCAQVEDDGGGACTPGCQEPTDCPPNNVCAAGECLIQCQATGPNTCGLGFYCSPSYFGGACTPGCQLSTDCPSPQVCLACDATCVTPGNDAGAPGAACGTDSDCATGGECLHGDAGYPGGYCSQSCAGLCSCGDGSACNNALGTCMATCDVNTSGSCRVGYACDSDGQGMEATCLPACGSDVDCAAYGVSGPCHPTEGICGNLPATTSASATTASGGSSSGTSGASSTGGTAASMTATSTGGSASAGTAGTTGSSASAVATAVTGTTGTHSSTNSGHTGCGCTVGSVADGAGSFCAFAALALRRRRRR